MSAIRLARGFTGRSLVVKFAGHYHGHVDCSSSRAPASPPWPFRTPPASRAEMAAETLVAALQRRRCPRGRLRRPRRPRSPASSPRPRPATWASSRRARLHRGAAAVTTAHGAARLRRGDDRLPRRPRRLVGPRGRRGRPRPDDLREGDGRGFPAAAFGDAADVMALLAPEGPVYQAGTLSGNPVATAAGFATLRAATTTLRPARPGRRTIAEGPRRELRPGVPTWSSGRGHVLRVLPRGRGAHLRRRVDQDVAAFWRFFHSMLRPASTCRRAPTRCFVSGAHDDARARRPRSPSRRRRCGLRGARAGVRGPQPRLRNRSHDDPARGRRRRSPTPCALSCTSCATARSTTPTASSTGGSTATTSPTSAGGWPTSPPSTSPTTTSPTSCRALSSGPARPRRPRRRARPRGHRRRPRHRGRNAFEGHHVAGGGGLLRTRGCSRSWSTRSARRGARPTSRSPSGCAAAIVDARNAARGHEAVIVCHQAPIWIPPATVGRPRGPPRGASAPSRR